MAINQPLGDPVSWSAASLPGPSLHGTRVLLRPVDAQADAPPLYAASHSPTGDPTIWTYLFDGPYDGVGQMRGALDEAVASEDPRFFSIVPFSVGTAAGIASYLRIEPAHGSIEIGNIWFGPELRRTAAATEAIYLLAHHAFDELGYRRLEWRCNALNAPSRRAAERFGFSFEGTFRCHQVVKGRNRDTAWYAIIADDWPLIQSAFQRWLQPTNFDADGTQRRSLVEIRTEASRPASSDRVASRATVPR